jgi:hypothetical protein
MSVSPPGSPPHSGLEPSAEFNIKSYGWKNGLWNADRALQQMLAAAAAAGGGVCRIPAGTYSFTKNAGGVGDISLIGDGYATVLNAITPGAFLSGGNLRNISISGIRFTGMVERMLSFSGSANLKFTDLWISGATRVGSGQPAGIRLEGCSNVEFTRVKCSGNGVGKGSKTFFGADIQLNGSGAKSIGALFTDVDCKSTRVEANVLVYDCSEVRGNVSVGGAVYNPNTGHSGYGLAWYVTKTNPGSCRGGNLSVTAADTEGSGLYCAGVTDFQFDARCERNGAVQPNGTLPVGGVALNGCARVTFSAISVFNAAADGVVFNNCKDVRGTSINVDRAVGWGVRLGGVVERLTVTRITTAATAGGIGDGGDALKSQLTLPHILVVGTTGRTQGVALYGLTKSSIGSVEVDKAGGFGIDIGRRANHNTFCHLIARDCGAGQPNVFAGVRIASDHSVLSVAVARNESTKNQGIGVDLAGVDFTVGIIQASGNGISNVKLSNGVSYAGNSIVSACPAG